jgi:hypothetical protein
MYKDINNLWIVCADDHPIHLLIDSLDDSHKVYIGHHHIAPLRAQGLSFDQAFYQQVGLSFKKRWTDFNVIRDIAEEQSLFEHFNLKKDSYIFIHDDPKRNFNINREHIVNKDLPVFIPEKTLKNNIFDYITILENAKEIHCIDSSFKLLADSVLEDRKNLFYHINLSGGIQKDPATYSQIKLSWKLI